MFQVAKKPLLVSTYNFSLPKTFDNQSTDSDFHSDSDDCSSEGSVSIRCRGPNPSRSGFKPPVHHLPPPTRRRWSASARRYRSQELHGSTSCRTTTGYIREITSPEIYPERVLYMTRQGAVSPQRTNAKPSSKTDHRCRRDMVSTPYSQQTHSDLLSAVHKAWFRSNTDISNKRSTRNHSAISCGKSRHRPASIAGELAARPKECKSRRDVLSARSRLVNFESPPIVEDRIQGNLERSMTDVDIVSQRLKRMCAERRARSSLTTEDIRARRRRRFTRKEEEPVVPVDVEKPSKLFRKFRLIAILATTMVKLLWVIIGISETKSVKTATELQWQTLYSTRRSSRKLSFDKSLYTRERATTTMPKWAIRILETLPELRTERESRQIHTMMKDMRGFDKFTEDIQINLCRAATYQCVTEGRVILRKGHIGYNFYFVFSGSAFVNVEEVDSAGETFVKTEAVVKKGDSFGELALLQEVKRTATVAARETIELLVVHKDTFAQVCPQIFEKELSEKESFLRRLPIFSEKWWKKDALEKLCLQSQIQEYSINKLIVKDSRRDNWVYVCMEGKAQIIRCLSLKDEDVEDKRSLAKKRQSAVFLSEELLKIYRDLKPKVKSKSGVHADDVNIEDKDEKEKLLESMALEYVETGKRKETFIEELDENERKKDMEYILGPKTLSSLMAAEMEKGKTDVIYLNIGTLHPDDIFDIHSIINDEHEANSYHLLVSYGARILKIKKSDLFHFATTEAVEHIKNITTKNKYPSNSVLLESYRDKATWDDYKSNVISGILKPHLHKQQKFPQGHLLKSFGQKTEEIRKEKLLATLKKNQTDSIKAERDRSQYEADLDHRQSPTLTDLTTSQEAKYPANSLRFHEPIIIRRKSYIDYIQRMDTLDVNIAVDKTVKRKYNRPTSKTILEESGDSRSQQQTSKSMTLAAYL
ncbi:hypothetical protein SNE40_022350 [Patella caerulea]|uniref:Cyclic nucleotide-binding domain-containing protein n=1 Tax=Patella caerulea TaxID=87958 RepID=A0AAN8G066_PATCE